MCNKDGFNHDSRIIIKFTINNNGPILPALREDGYFMNLVKQGLAFVSDKNLIRMEEEGLDRLKSSTIVNESSIVGFIEDIQINTLTYNKTISEVVITYKPNHKHNNKRYDYYIPGLVILPGYFNNIEVLCFYASEDKTDFSDEKVDITYTTRKLQGEDK